MIVTKLAFHAHSKVYRIPVRSKYTIVQGESGTGKSTLINRIDWTTADPSVSIITDINAFIIFMRRVDTPFALLDESTVYALDNDQVDQMNKANCQFIVISRKIPGKLAVDYRDIYVLQYDDIRTYNCVRKYPDFLQFDLRDTVITEDGKSCYLYLHDQLGDRVKPANGKDRIAKHPEIANSVVVADGSAIGSAMEELCKADAQLYLPISFEYLCVKHELGGKADKDLYARWKPDKHLSLERMFTEVLVNLTSKHIHRYRERYSKSRLSAWVAIIPYTELFQVGSESAFEMWLDRYAPEVDRQGNLLELWERYRDLYYKIIGDRIG